MDTQVTNIITMHLYMIISSYVFLWSVISQTVNLLVPKLNVSNFIRSSLNGYVRSTIRDTALVLYAATYIYVLSCENSKNLKNSNSKNLENLVNSSELNTYVVYFDIGYYINDIISILLLLYRYRNEGMEIMYAVYIFHHIVAFIGFIYSLRTALFVHLGIISYCMHVPSLLLNTKWFLTNIKNCTEYNRTIDLLIIVLWIPFRFGINLYALYYTYSIWNTIQEDLDFITILWTVYISNVSMLLFNIVGFYKFVSEYLR
jgi:hypothetical protein